MERGLLTRDLLVSARAAAVNYCVRQGLIQSVAADTALATPGAALSGLGFDDPRWIGLQQACYSALPALRAAVHPSVETLMDVPVCAAQGDICRLTLPGQPHLTTRPHQDYSYIGDPEMWTVWIPLVDCPLPLGPLCWEPNSWSRGALPHSTAPDSGEGLLGYDGSGMRSVALQVGDAVFFHALTVHGARDNQTSDRARLSVDLRFTPVA